MAQDEASRLMMAAERMSLSYFIFLSSASHVHNPGLKSSSGTVKMTCDVLGYAPWPGYCM